MSENKTSSSTSPSFLPKSAWLIAVNAGLLLIVAGTAMPLLHITGLLTQIIYTAGAVLVLGGRLFAPSLKGHCLRVRRLSRLEIWVGLMFCTGAFFMWYTPDRMDWLAFTLAGAALQVYASIAIPGAMAKELKDKTGSKDDKKQK